MSINSKRLWWGSNLQLSTTTLLHGTCTLLHQQPYTTTVLQLKVLMNKQVTKTHKEVERAGIWPIVHAFVKFPDSLQVIKEQSISADRLQENNTWNNWTLKLIQLLFGLNCIAFHKVFSQLSVFAQDFNVFRAHCLSSNAAIRLALKKIPYFPYLPRCSWLTSNCPMAIKLTFNINTNSSGSLIIYSRVSAHFLHTVISLQLFTFSGEEYSHPGQAFIVCSFLCGLHTCTYQQQKLTELSYQHLTVMWFYIMDMQFNPYRLINCIWQTAAS